MSEVGKWYYPDKQKELTDQAFDALREKRDLVIKTYLGNDRVEWTRFSPIGVIQVVVNNLRSDPTAKYTQEF